MVKKFGYARVSTDKQCLDRQIDALIAYGVKPEDIFTEKYTGTKANRPEFDKLKIALREGDTIVIESLSRLGRSSKDLLALVEDLNNKGIVLVSLKEKVDISDPTGRMLLAVLSALCQFERDLTVQRTTEGLAAARARGRCGGRPKTDQKKINKALKLYDAQTHSTKEIAELSGISVKTLYNALEARKAGTAI
jgi:DNA invertase Pin-like site-specific DNA recombinase